MNKLIELLRKWSTLELERCTPSLVVLGADGKWWDYSRPGVVLSAVNAAILAHRGWEVTTRLSSSYASASLEANGYGYYKYSHDENDLGNGVVVLEAYLAAIE